jgi:hypothetical protein
MSGLSSADLLEVALAIDDLAASVEGFRDRRVGDHRWADRLPMEMFDWLNEAIRALKEAGGVLHVPIARAVLREARE